MPESCGIGMVSSIPALGDRCRYPARRIRIQPPISLAAKPYFKRVAVCGTVFFSIFGAVCVFVAATNADGSFANPILAACVFGAFWGAFILLGIYLWLFSCKYRLEITENAIEQFGVFSHRRISTHKIQNAKWRNWPQGGSIKLRTGDSQMSIELGTSDSRELLIQFLHAEIPMSKQQGWETFRYNPENSNGKNALRFHHLWLGVIFYAFAASFIVAWLMGLGAVNLVAAAVNCGFAVYLMTRKIAG